MRCAVKAKNIKENNFTGSGIRCMVKEDLPVILSMASKEGWIFDSNEFYAFIEFNPFGCFVYMKGGKVVGSIMTFSHSESAWIGNFVVLEEYRLRGIGKKLLSQAIKYLDNKKIVQIYLNAAYGARKLYEKFGFSDIMIVNRWEGKTGKQRYNRMDSETGIPDILGFLKLDAFLWRDDRFSLISQLSSTRQSRSQMDPPGFLMYGDVGKVSTIGPWESKGADEDAAEKLFVSGLSKLEPERRVLLDVPAANKIAGGILTRHSFIIVSSVIFMCRGKPPKIHFNQIFSFASMGSMG